MANAAANGPGAFGSKPPSEPSDRTLAGRFVRDGDERAFRRLYERHSPPLEAFIRGLVRGDEQLAADLQQDTWLRATRGLAAFRWQSTFRTWLTAIAINRHRTRLARQRRAPSARPIDGRDRAIRPPDHCHLMDVTAAIADLPEGRRTVLLLYAVEGYPHTEIARKLGISEGGSRSQLHHARRTLREALRI